VESIVIGSGGSAFVDGGFGATYLGMDLFKVYHRETGNLIDPSEMIRPFEVSEKLGKLKLVTEDILDKLEILMPCDVQNPMLGLNGAAYVFGPQKGAKPEDL
jgi:glycerate kinase